jgi:hypothetical protein
MRYVVYAWVDDLTPFYIGKGLPNRPYESKSRNPHTLAKKKSSLTKGTFSVIILLTHLTNDQACSWEKKLISEIGLESLTNFTEGGDGGNTQSGWSTERKEEFRSLMRTVNSNRPKQSYGEGSSNTFWVNNGEKNRRLKVGTEVPEGYEPGRTPHLKPYKWITDGKDSRQVPLDYPPPEGWYPGQKKAHYRGKPL